ncbi:hypothetical protein Shyhy02_06320 [Streptomyces hygroscopicus subsp. hygroscopicus]|nr:hypothetical protein Shyhy02_06320 [Streptomyces hygroscopicus subsp. hygroscopicus]
MTATGHRREHDLLGDRDVPADACWGVHTLRAGENFPITRRALGNADGGRRETAAAGRGKHRPGPPGGDDSGPRKNGGGPQKAVLRKRGIRAARRRPGRG